jgi:hypothetical protein
VKVEMSSSEVDVVLRVVLMLVEMKLGMDRVLMNGKGVRHNVVSGQKVVGVLLLGHVVALGELREPVAELGSLAAVGQLSGEREAGLVLILVGVAVVDESVLVVVGVGVLHDGVGLREFSLEQLLHVHAVGSELVVGGAGLNESERKHQKLIGEHGRSSDKSLFINYYKS